MDGFADAGVRAAAADVGDGGIELLVGGRGIRGEKSADGHDHAGLAVAALRDLMIDPGLLHWSGRGAAEAFDGGDFGVGGGRDRDAAAAHRFSVEVDGAGTASADAAAVFGAGEAEFVAQDPKERCIGFDVDVVSDAVNFEMDGHRYPQSWSGPGRER